VEEAGELYSGALKLNFPEWVSQVRLTATRAAVIVADELTNCVALYRQLEGDLAGLQGEALSQGIHAMQDLLRFWVSAEAFALRQRLGLL
jgi:hypothetical protein